jgi:predicted amidophosphoribosyltransferase
LDGLLSVYLYKLSIEEAVKRLKYRFVQDLGEAFVDVCVKRMGEPFREFVKRDGFVVVSVPLHRARKRWRGFNQAALLGRILAKRMGLRYENVLMRTKNTGSLAELRVRLTDEEKEQLNNKYASGTQRRMARKRKLLEKKTKARAEQMSGAFAVNSKFRIENAKLLLVDDVWTSGATMLECAKVLKRAKADLVWGVTFARSGR